MKDFKLGAQVPKGLIESGQKLGFKYGGAVKGGDTSGEFKMKTGPMADMDDGVQPARKGRTQQEVEAGGQSKLRPKFAEGGEAKKNPYKKGTARYKLWMRREAKREAKKPEEEGMKSFSFEVDGKERTVHAKTREEAKQKLKKTLGAQYTEKEAQRQSKSTKYMEEHGIKKGGSMKKKYMKGGHASTANKKMPSGVKKRGGLAHASKYKHGGYNSEPMFGKK